MAQNSIYVADVSVFTISILSNDLSIFRKSLILYYLQDCCICHILCVLSSDTHLALVLHFTLLYFCMLYIFVKTIVDFWIFYLEICISLFLFFFLQNALPYPFLQISIKNSQLSRESHIFHKPVLLYEICNSRKVSFFGYFTINRYAYIVFPPLQG